MNAQPIKVLLVGHESVHAGLAREVPRAKARLELSRAGRIEEAGQRLGEGAFDVVLLDLMAPDAKGLAGFRDLRAAVPSMPVVVLAGADDEALAFQAVREGAQDYLVKGEFDGPMLSRVIRYAIERKRAEEELRQSAEFFKLISENVTDLIAVIDRDGKRLYNSPSYEKSLGDASHLQGTNSFQEIHPDDKEKITRIFQETIATGAGRRSEYRMLLSDGSIRHIESQGSVIKDANGRTSKVVVVSRDITERIRQMEVLQKALAELHEAHEELKTAQMQLVQSEKLEAVSTFAGGIAHEVKNPLQTIILGVDFLKNTLETAGEDVKMVLTEMDNAARRADAVIRGMVEFSSYNKRDVRDHDLSRIVEQSLRSVESEMTAHSVRLFKDLASSLPPVRLDLKTVKHVFINLLLGSIRAMSGGGTLTVKTFLKQLSKDEGWSGRTPGQLKAGDTVVAAEVEDDGPGVIESKLADKSERAFATELIRKGVLDLMVLKKVVELYGGMIRIINRKEGGVKVTVMFKTQRKEGS
ncbi:MAG TPA: PAS domain S-box protein [Candidatus Angelobacter sp.]|nr:PAS domain S-box protein [Candidatus Angelobacter sp.]